MVFTNSQIRGEKVYKLKVCQNSFDTPLFYRDLISFLMKEPYESAKQMTVAAISPVSCGQTTIKLCPSGSGLGIAP